MRVKFTDTKGGTELGIRVNNEASNFQDAKFERQPAARKLLATSRSITPRVRCIANIDLQSLAGQGRLEKIARRRLKQLSPCTSSLISVPLQRSTGNPPTHKVDSNSAGMYQTNPAPWFSCPKNGQPSQAASLLFSIRRWFSFDLPGMVELLPAGVAVWPVQLPGRGSRYKEPPYVSMPALVNAVANAIEPFLDLPFVFFGHSMGAMMSFELAQAVRERFQLQPKHLFVSGSGGPHLPGPVRTFTICQTINSSGD